MKVRDYSDTAGPGARKVDGPGGPQKRIDLTPASGRSRCGAPTMTLRYAQPSPKAPAPSRETARFQWQFRWQYVGAQEGIRGHAKGATRGAGRTSRSFARRCSAADVGARGPLLDEPRVGRAYPAPLDGALQRLVVRGRERLVRRVERRERRGIERRGRAED